LLPLMMMQRMAGGGQGGAPGGGIGGFGGRGQNRADQANRISIGVDARTNTLVVTATDPLYEEVKELVQKLDVAAGSQDETVRVVTLHRTSASAVAKTLEAFAGDAVQNNTPTSSTSAAANANNNAVSSTPPWWANRGLSGRNGGAPGGQPWMGGGGQFGGNSPFQRGFGGQGGQGGRSRFSQPGAGGQ
jgi:hypothetical protein